MLQRFFLHTEKRGERPHSSERGFTLLEIMVAITLLTFVFGIVYSTFAAISSSDRKVTAIEEIALSARNLFQVMMKDVGSAYLPANAGSGKERESTLFYGFIADQTVDDGEVNFTALVSSGTTNPLDRRIEEIGYSLLKSDDGTFRLMKRIDATPDGDIGEGGETFELLRDVTSLKFSFRKSDGEWADSWDSTTLDGPPLGIKMEIALSDGGSESAAFTAYFPVGSGKRLFK